MKVRDASQVPVAQSISQNAQASGPRSKEDRVTLEKTQELKATIDRAKVSAGAGRAAQLQALEASLKNGTFKPNASQIADKLLQAAEVDARLRALLDTSD